jgi:outer membrane protein OmpA-like peptidoglycan-associated protein
MLAHRSTFALLACLACLGTARAGEPDAEGCKDHPLVTRMPGYRLEYCENVEFDSHEFPKGPDGHGTVVEGRRTKLQYAIDEGRTAAGGLQVVRNYENAVVRIGGKAVASYEDGGILYRTLRVVSGGRESWIQVEARGGECDAYTVVVVDKAAMAQAVVADAAALKDGLAATGHVEVPGILFDTGKATLKPESDKALGELAKLLAGSPKLKVYVVGHTDNAGELAANLALSAARADAVVKALVGKFKVDAKRLAPFGAGPYAPVASNASEEGRAKNRRVELVAQ